MSNNYKHTTVEKKWQDRWENENIYQADIKSSDKFYNLWMFPYPSAEGLHAGHAFASTGSDIYGRFMRMNGSNVLQTIGYDSFGIHSENYAIKIGETPQIMLKRTTKHYEDQLRSLGHGYDWSRTVTTSEVGYYKWTQWLFAEMFKSGLAYKKKASVNFCPSCKTVLADEQVMSPQAAGKEPKDKDGNVVPAADDMKVCERCGTVVEKKDLDQWFFRITNYADRLLTGLDEINWSERVAIAQREWIGKKAGVIVRHKVKDSDMVLDAFSAYPAWLYADTFLVIAPKHPKVLDLVKGTEYEEKVMAFVKESDAILSNEEKAKKEKNGIFTGRYVVDNLTGRQFPVWLANFALMDFGTGIIRCSAHDPRDWEFAQKYEIPTEEVVDRVNPDEPVNAHTNFGKLKHSGPFSGRMIDETLIEDLANFISQKNLGERATTYHLRDWLVSRQRYWGAPIPMIYCESCRQKAVGYLSMYEASIYKDHSDWDHFGWWVDDNLPIELPPMKNYEPDGTGQGPLSHHPEFYEVKCPHCGEVARRETDVMDTFVDSSWYFLRYPSVGSKNSSKIAFDLDITKKWLPVDLYFGGAEHSVLHLMYARFVTMVMHDRGYVPFNEPFPKFFAHGLMIKDGAKMSKSRGNVVNPDEYVAKFGADTLRLYVMFMGPMDGYPDFRDTGIEGMARFVSRVWNLFDAHKDFAFKDKTDADMIISKLHQTIHKVTEDVSNFKYNTAIASLMEFVNALYEKINEGAKNPKESSLSEWRDVLKGLTLMLAPFAPHLSEELWVEVLGEPFSVHKAGWPEFNPDLIKTSSITVVVQVNGKVRGQLTVDPKDSQDETMLKALAESDQNISKWLSGEVKKVIFVPGKIINFVVIS